MLLKRRLGSLKKGEEEGMSVHDDALYTMLYLWGLGGEEEARGIPCGKDGGG